jgi:hypothetical protein
LPKVDQADVIDTEFGTWKEMEQLKVVATANDKMLEQVTLGLPPKPDTISPTNVDKYMELTEGQFFPSEVVAILAM